MAPGTIWVKAVAFVPAQHLNSVVCECKAWTAIPTPSHAHIHLSLSMVARNNIGNNFAPLDVAAGTIWVKGGHGMAHWVCIVAAQSQDISSLKLFKFMSGYQTT
jgi:hypothetical protein